MGSALLTQLNVVIREHVLPPPPPLGDSSINDPEEAGHDHVMRTIIEIPSDSSIHFLRRETRSFFTGRPEGISLKL